MANYAKALQRGLVYGSGKISGDGVPGQFVVMNDNNEFVVNIVKETESWGMLLNSLDPGAEDQEYEGGDYCAVAYDNGIYETDNFTKASLQKGDFLAIADTTGIIKEWASGDAVVGVVLSVATGKLVFKLSLRNNNAVE